MNFRFTKVKTIVSIMLGTVAGFVVNALVQKGPSSYQNAEGVTVIVDNYPDFRVAWGIIILAIIIVYLLWSFFRKKN